MPLPPGARLGPYEVRSLIGVGGMGEVYTARDLRLDRDVAIKVLSSDVVERPDRRRRFDSEARAISSLQHPHICTLFDVGEQDGIAFFVMEFLEGETLDDRLSRGPLAAAQVLTYGLQIADALEHAHHEGFVHRDLKPGNVMLGPSGVKLLDFGLVHRTFADSTAPVSSTLSFEQRPLTTEGAILGTLQYMAPEQLEGKDVDARTDIFAFGAVMFEMATGHKAFSGSNQASLIASVLTHSPPPVSSLRGDSELAIELDHVVERCLAKDPADRWHSARDVKLELEWISSRRGKPARAKARSRTRAREAIAWSVAAVAIAATVFSAIRAAGVNSSSEDVTRFTLTPPLLPPIAVFENATSMALSPDGRHVAYIATSNGPQQLWIYSMASGTARSLAGTDGAVSPFWSPDSRMVGYVAKDHGEIRKIDIAGGPPLTVCTARVEGAPTWDRDGGILFTQYVDGIYRVSGEGGTPVRLTTVDKSRREMNHYWPNFLPGGRHFTYLATALDENGLRVTPTVYVASVDAAAVTTLARLHSKMVYAPPGYLLFVEQGALLAQRFDAEKLALSGEPVKIADGIGYLSTIGHASFSVSAAGTLAYQGAGADSQLMWYDSRGNATGADWPVRNYGSLRFSPDGQRVAVDVTDDRTGTADIWIYDVARGAPLRFTAYPHDESDPVWSPDARRILFRMNRGRLPGAGSAAPNLYAKTIAGAAEDEVMVPSRLPLNPEDWSANGQWIAYTTNTPQTRNDLSIVAVAGDRTPRLIAGTPFKECCARFSPDSQRIAFVSDESGTEEVYVAMVPDSDDKTRISVGGGTSPRWRRDGKTVFYAAPDHGAIMSVAIEWTPRLKVARPVRLFVMPPAATSTRGTFYDVAPDGDRFLVNTPIGLPASSRMTIVQNWLSILSR